MIHHDYSSRNPVSDAMIREVTFGTDGDSEPTTNEYASRITVEDQ